MELAKAVRDLTLVAGTLIVLALTVPVNAQVAQNARVLAKFETDIETGRLAESEKEVSNYAFAHPTDAKALELFARLRLKQGRIDEAIALYKKVLALDPQFTSAKVNYITALLLAGRSDAASEILNGIDPARIKDLITRLNLAQARVLAGNCDQALTVVASLPAKVLNTDALAIRATCYVQLGRTNDLDALVPLAEKAVTLSPSAVMRFAGVMIDAGRSKTAIDILQLILRSRPNDAKTLTMLGKAELMEKNFASARRHLISAAGLDLLSPEVAYLQAELEFEQGNAIAALPFLKKALQLAPNSPDILAQMALTSIKAGQPQDGVEAAEKLLALKPNDPDGVYLLGAAALQSGDVQKARSNLERYAILRPKDTRGCVALGLAIAAQKDQIEPARQQLLHCLEIDPTNVEAKYQIGLSYKAQGDTAQAIHFLEQTVIDAPKYALALRDLGTVYLQAGNELKAREMLERSVAIDPNDAETHFQLSRLYNLIGEADLAKQHLATFQKIKNKKGQ
ncbi:MAG TPA: tetratricopeptide repeat protein [Pyrinomonadaceae bacterium]|jgi:cellulose synthase operon protein C|nr:tetratricopeptide repeat protein [Pyrinomonadaceae bacterium]